MKKLLFFALVSTSVFSFQSCKEDDNLADLIKGAWFLQKSETHYGNGVVHEEIPDSCEANTVYNYNEDFTLDARYYGLDSSGQCTYHEQFSTYNIDLENSELSIYTNGNTRVYTIANMNQNELVLFIDEYDYDNDNKIDRDYLYLYK